MATRHLFWAVTRPGWNKRAQLSAPSAARSRAGRASPPAPAPQWPHCSGLGAQLRWPGWPVWLPDIRQSTGPAAGWGPPPLRGGMPAPSLRHPAAPPRGGRGGDCVPARQSPVGVSPLPRAVAGSVQGETRLAPPCMALGGFLGRGRGKYGEMRHTGVTLSSPTPETWLKISPLPWPAPLVLAPLCQTGGESNPTGSSGLQNGPRDGRAGMLTNPPSSQEQTRARAGVGADTLQRIPDLQEIPAPTEPSRGSAPRQPGAAENQSPRATARRGSSTLRPAGGFKGSA